MAECSSCSKSVDVVCQDGYCKACHVSVSFDDCCDGTWSVNVLRRSGTREETLREMYPDADFTKVLDLGIRRTDDDRQ